LLELADKLSVASRVVIAGWQDDARSQLTAMDVYAAPSRLEGFPLGVCEAMLAGLPVVASAVGSMSEAVVEGRTGLLVPPEQPEALAAALRALCRNEKLRGELGAAGRRRALQLFSVDAMTRAYESLYEELGT
jgi:glycosyltransferase involved in cell wall biosynthesis